MSSKALGKIVNLKQWKNLPISQFKDSGYPVYGANGVIGFYDEYNHENPTIAITCRGATCGNVHITREKSYITSNAMSLDDLNENECTLNYLAQYLRFRGLSDVTTGAAQPQITRTNLEKVIIPLPPLNDQIRIAHLLGKVEGLIAQRKENLRQLDELLKSVFLKMFGDPVRNTKDWKTDSLANLGVFKNGMNFSKGESGVQVRCLGVGDFKSLSKITDTDHLSTIDLDAAPPPDYFLRNGDLIFVRSNGNRDLVGRCIAIYPNDKKITYSGFCIRFRITQDAINATYLTHLFRAPSFRRLMLQGGQGANIQNINQQSLSNLPIPVPSSELQKQFAHMVEIVEDINARYQQSLSDLENLYGALSQKAFKGELDLSRVPLPQRPDPSQHEETNPPEQSQDGRTHSEEQAEISNADLSQIEQLDIPAMSTAQGRAKLLGRLFETYIKEQHSDAPLSLDDFWQNLQLKTLDYMDEDSEPLGLADYDLVKKCLFRFLETSEVVQTFNEDKNRLELQARG